MKKMAKKILRFYEIIMLPWHYDGNMKELFGAFRVS